MSSSKLHIIGLELVPAHGQKPPAQAVCHIASGDVKVNSFFFAFFRVSFRELTPPPPPPQVKLESDESNALSVVWSNVDVTIEMPTRDALLRDVQIGVVGYKMRLSPFSTSFGECTVPISALAGAHATPLTVRPLIPPSLPHPLLLENI